MQSLLSLQVIWKVCFWSIFLSYTITWKWVWVTGRECWQIGVSVLFKLYIIHLIKLQFLSCFSLSFFTSSWRYNEISDSLETHKLTCNGTKWCVINYHQLTNYSTIQIRNALYLSSNLDNISKIISFLLFNVISKTKTKQTHHWLIGKQDNNEYLVLKN